MNDGLTLSTFQVFEKEKSMGVKYVIPLVLGIIDNYFAVSDAE